ncbi:MAG: DUF4191 domain-containing protein [Brooklawnia sp.]|jgi:hypothetical protein
MARSERAKELAARQKAEAKAMRAAKRNSDNPRDWGTIKQIRESYRLTKQVDPKLNLWLIGTWLLVTAAVTGLGLAFRTQWYWALPMGILMGITAALLLLTQRTKKGTYTRYKGQPGAGEVPLSMLNKKKWTVQPAITVTRQQDCIHRVVGAAGVVLVGDGSAARLKQPLASETRRHQQVLYGINVETIQMGDEPGQVPMEKLQKHIQGLPKTLDSLQLEEVESRLKALDAMKQRIPLPKGPLPTSTKGARKAMRGR